MKFIGDIHGNVEYYKFLLSTADILKQRTIQLGDMGFGFPGVNFPNDFGDNHKFIRGNHENPTVCRIHKNYLGEFGYNKDFGVFFVSGADSVDKSQRTPELDWWRDEEIPYVAFVTDIIPLYMKIKPRIVISHDCPVSIKSNLITYGLGWPDSVSKTQLALQHLFESWQPEYWIFGHYHRNKQVQKNGTTFVCVNTSDTFKLEF